MINGKKSRSLFFAILLLAGAVHLCGCHYIFKAMIHGTPNIDDLDLFPYRTIRAAPEPRPWPRADDYNTAILDPELRDTLEDYGTVAFVVLKKGQVQYEEYWHGYAPKINSNSFSAAKSIVSILVGQALDQGYIDSLDQPVGDFLPEFATGRKKEITIRNVLMMASGLNFDEAYNEPFSHTTDAYYGKNLRRLINSLEVVEEPGTVYSYRSGDTMLLGMVLEAATGMPLSDFAEKNLWQPLGAVGDAQWSLDRAGGLEKAYCCFYANARDFARIGHLYLNRGRVNGRQLVPESYVKESLEPIRLPNRKGETVDYYGYQWWLYNFSETPVYYARGILGQYIFVIPDKDMVVVRLGHQRSRMQVEHHPREVHTLIRGFMTTF
ncbi:MAG: serine hydrolase [Desulfosudaceae bacterium]